MDALFLKLLNMGIAAGWVILAVLLLRILLKRAPKALGCALWILVGVRLVCPFSIESMLSLIPSAETVPREITLATEPVIHSGIDAVDSAVNPVIASSLAPKPWESANPMQIAVFLASRLWAAGMAAMLFYALVSYLRLRRKVRAAMVLRENIWLCDAVSAPFILGILFPRIYLPSDLQEPQCACVIAHEKAHLRRRDHWWKPLGFLLLSVYWFQPLCWVAYILLCRDIELACDEYVVRRMEDGQKKIYANALLSCSLKNRGISACPLAFGEVGIKERIKGILSYRKPAFWIVAVAVISCVLSAVCLLTDPESSKNSDNIYGARYTVAEVLYDAPWYNAAYMPDNAPDFIITSEAELLQRNFSGIMGNNPVWNRVGVFHESDLTENDLFALFASPQEQNGGGTDIPGLSQEARRLLESAERVWRVDAERDSGSARQGMTCYLVVQTESNQVLLAACYGEADMEEAHSREHIRFLWRMERHADPGDTAYLEGQIASMSSGKNIQIFALYESESMPDTLLAGYLDDGRGFAVFRRDPAVGTGWKIKGFGSIVSGSTSQERPADGGGAFESVTIGEDWGFDHSITIAVSGSRDLASVTAEAGGETQSVAAGRNGVPDLFVFEWPGILSPEDTEAVRVYYYDALGEELGATGGGAANF